MRSLFSAAMLTAAIALSPLVVSAAPAPSATPAPAATTAPAATPAPVKAAPATAAKATDAKAEKMAKTPSAGQQAMHERQKACGAEWKSVKGTKAAEGKKWPQFWSECNKRLKEQGK